MPLLHKRKSISGLQTHRKSDDMSSLEWHWSSSLCTVCFIFLWDAVLKCVLRSEGHGRRKVTQLNLWGGCIYGGETTHWLGQKNTAWFWALTALSILAGVVTGSVSECVIIRILVVPPTRNYNCNNSCQSCGFGQNANSLTYYMCAVLRKHVYRVIYSSENASLCPAHDTVFLSILMW